MNERWTKGIRLCENVLLPVVLACTVGAVFILTNANFPFANGGNCDPWYFFGRFFDADQVSVLSHTRESSRPPLFIVGYLTTRLFHGIDADYANFLVLYVSATTAVYYAAKRLFGLVPAIVAAIFFATNPQIIGNYSVTFSAPAVTYSAIAIAFAIAAAKMQRSRFRIAALLAAGFFWGSAVHGHLFSLSFNFIVMLYCLDWSRRLDVRFLLEAIRRWLLVLGGALIATAVFGAINAALFHGDFLFFMNQYRAIFTVKILEYEKLDWYLLGGHGALLLVGIAATIAQAYWVWRRGLRAPEVQPILSALIPYTALEIVQIIYRLNGGLPLQYDYYFVFVLPPLALLIASLVSHAVAARTATIMALVLYFILSIWADFGRTDLIWYTVTTFAPSLAVAIVFSIALIWLRRYPTATVLASLFLFVALNATVRTEKFGLPIWLGGDGRSSYERLRTGMEFVSSYRFPVMPKFWINAGGALAETVAYPRSFDQCPVDIALPDFLTPSSPYYSPGTEVFSPGDYLVMVAANLSDLGKAVDNLKRRHLALEEIGRRDIAYNGTSYVIVIGRLH